VLVVISLGFFMTLLDLTIVNIAIPNMITKLHASFDDVLWVINAYALVLAVLVITGGRLGDLIGPRTMFAGGVAVFTVASAACGLAPSPGWLIAFRSLQGVGAAMLMPQTLAIITMIFPPERRGAAFGVWGAVAGAATIAGPTVGGLLITAFDWRWIFYVNVPIGVIVLALTWMLIPNLRPGRKHRMDYLGVLLASAALLAICYGLVEGQTYNWGKINSFLSIPLVLGAGVVLLAAFLVVQWLQQSGEPLVPFSVFRDRNFALMNFVSGTLVIGMMGIFLPFTIYLQSVLGFSALKAGLTMAPSSLISVFIAPLAGRWTDKIGGKYILITGLTLFAGGMGWMFLIAKTTSSWVVFLPALIVAGVGMGCTFAPLTTTAMRNIEPRMAGAASGLLNTVRQVGTVIGTAAVGALLQNRLVTAWTTQAASQAHGLPPSVRGQFVTGFRDAAKSGLQVGTGQTGVAVKLPPGAPTSLLRQIEVTSADVFTHGFVTAMRATAIMPVAVMLLAAAACFAIKQNRRTAAPLLGTPAPQTAPPHPAPSAGPPEPEPTSAGSAKPEPTSAQT
jgi:EmrB/QacA subfamily drug resistance transporter